MARFYGSLTGDQAKTDATRIGRNTLKAHIRGWNVGVKIFCEKTENGKIKISIYRTNGSNDPTIQEFVAVVEGVE